MHPPKTGHPKWPQLVIVRICVYILGYSWSSIPCTLCTFNVATRETLLWLSIYGACNVKSRAHVKQSSCVGWGNAPRARDSSKSKKNPPPKKRERERAFDVHFRDNIIGILKASWRMVAMLGSRRPASSCTATCVMCGVTILTTWSYKVAGQLADTMGGNCFDCNVISRGDSSSKAIVICSRAAMCW